MTINEITARLGITLSKMQKASIGAILNTRDNIVVLSPTGSGKTLAYLLPLSQLVDTASDTLQAVVIVPGRELANQSLEVLQSMKTGIRGYSCHGGRPAMDEHREMRKVMPQVLFATPGRLNDHIGKGNITTDGVRFIVIDEFDKCLELGFADEMSTAVNSMPPTARQFFLSATDMEELGNIRGYAPTTQGFTRLDFREERDEDKVAVYTVQSPDKDKLYTLSKVLRSLEGASTIVFLNYRDSVERAAQFLKDEGFVVSVYHGGIDQREREEALYRFANGSTNVLLTTDLGSRGLDIPDVAAVINYHLPETHDNYTHRVGRTARWDKTGKAFFILAPGETLPAYVKNAKEYEIPSEDDLAMPQLPMMATLYIGKGKKDKISKADIVGFLCHSGGLTGREIGRIDVYDWYAYAAIAAYRLHQVLHNLQGEKIKGKRTRVEEMR